MTHEPAQPQHTATKIEGIIFITGKGVGYVNIPDTEEDIEIAPDKTGNAFHKDTVHIKLLSKGDTGRMQGEVLSVITRARTKFVGTTFSHNEQTAFRPDDRHIPKDFTLNTTSSQIPPQTKVYVEVTSWGDSVNPPQAKVIEVLGPKGDHEAETKSILLSHDIDTRFPEKVEQEAEEIKANHHISLEGRRDLRDRPTCTIDPVDAKDFDDALSLKVLEAGWYEVGIHIADVSHFVRPGTELDREARARAFSVYLVDRTIPMLPEILSNDLCSLNPEEDKYAFSAVFEMNIQGHIRARWFGKSIITSDKRFTYENAQAVLDGRETHPLEEGLKTLETIAKALRAERQKIGAIDFDSEEIKFELDEHKRPIRIYKKERLETMRLVEDFMLLANREVAKHVALPSNGKPVQTFVYRTHDLPNPEKIEHLSIFLEALGYSLGKKHDELTPKDIQKLLNDIDGAPEEGTIKTAVLRSMAKATYSTVNIGHFGLAFEHYTHFTSPIRRYPDLMAHRLLQNFLDGVQEKKDIKVTYENILRDATEKEISVMNAERDSIRMKQVEYMQNHIGEIFEGTITGATEWGVYVEEKNTKSEGMIRLKDLGSDYFELDPKTYAIVGSKTKKKFAIGDTVKIRLTGVNLDERTIDWSLVA